MIFKTMSRIYSFILCLTSAKSLEKKYFDLNFAEVCSGSMLFKTGKLIFKDIHLEMLFAKTDHFAGASVG